MTTEYEIIAEGKYKARAIEAGLGESKSGNPQAAVLFRIVGGEHDGDTITWYGSFSENKGAGTKTPLQRTIESLRACGWQGDNLADLSSIAEENEIDVGLVIEHDEHKGKVSAKVKWVNRGGGLGLTTPMKTDSAQAFAAKMRGKVLAASKNIPPVVAKSKERVPGEDDMDDVGF